MLPTLISYLNSNYVVCYNITLISSHLSIVAPIIINVRIAD